LLRLGCYALLRPKEPADDWAYLIDHTIQIGSMKCFVILGIRLTELPAPERCLAHHDLQLIALVPMVHSTGEVVAAELEKAARQTNPPRLIVSDHGGDVKKGVELFCERHPDTVATYDIAHKGACLLQRLLEKDEQWSTFNTRLGQTKAKILQTPAAPLVAPGLRLKARYMNLGAVLRWGRRMLNLLDRPPATEGPAARAETAYGWLREYREALNQWWEYHEVIQQTVSFVRRRGLYNGVAGELACHLVDLPVGQLAMSVADELVGFVEEQARFAQTRERLIASTEVLESCFGKVKQLEWQQSASGFTGMILALGAIVTNWTTTTIQTALDKTPIKVLANWIECNLGRSVQAERRAAFALPPPVTKPA
jgi:hypothetical protein